ncbi:glycogen synthase GlgA [candidate division KSB1 bacterium]|nr:glycogen synthase GlgA [candidate division KSB1 bacterium]
MKNRLRILFLASEVDPFAKTGGLADVASALPKSLFEKGHDVRVMMPKYGSISERKYVLRDVIRLRKLSVKMGAKEHIASAKSAFIPDTKVQVYFLDYKPFFDKKDLYVDQKTGRDFSNNAERFAFFCRAALETAKLLHWEPDIIHCNDWQTALIPWLLKNEYRDEKFFSDTATLLSIHNLAFQGNFAPESIKDIGLPQALVKEGGEMEFYGQASFLKLGVGSADAITTVSPSYAKEIQTPEFGSGFDKLLKARSKDLTGILNGVDYTIWDPEKDAMIPVNYTVNNLQDKLENKRALLKQAKLPFDESVPVIGMISRLTEQKGFDLIEKIKDKLFERNVQLVILGTGDPHYQNMLETLSKENSDKLALFVKFDEELAHLIEAGTDMFLMPSRFEPCGLNQMYSLRYGTLPVVHNIGGLKDTVIDIDKDSSKGTGFTFDNYDETALLATIDRALALFGDDKSWLKIVKRAMKQNFSWDSAAEDYVKMYQKIVSGKRK